MADDIQGLPDVDLTPVLDSLEQSAPKEEPSVRTETKPTEELDLGQFKNPKDLLKSYKEIQAAFTRVTQENKSHKEKELELAQLREQVELLRSSANRPIHQEPQKRFDEAFVENPEAAIQQQITRTVMTSRIAEVLEEEAEKNRDDFNERYAFAQQVAQQYPQLATSPTGVKKLFQFGDKLRQDALKKNASKALESIFGEPLAEEEIAKLRKMVKGDKAIKQPNNNSDAYMPDTSTSTRTGTDTTRPDADHKMKEAVEKGDVDGAIDALFKGILAD
jgi:hypothetical protein